VPKLTVINNVDVAIVREPAGIRDALVRQAASPVRWVETITKMVQMGATHIVECGPGKVLAGMVTRIEPELVAASVADPTSLAAAAALLQ
jgi:[acyl-carrier-protein] S-malonyltransferase